ncbi:16S rRNA (uracil(1498)-N(3))-methyltransferase [Candidatus Woesearchaeota archaeon]|nr:16S rRNA (uracil(1498)-N(3))-methyltransferase [Candidatus Woesearchaeota archaeon]MBW2994066.1 16S rRNA (uracil(1498)-N(3))-methyltransferase [Candidatus Woesearchaeota archaeon]
MAKITRFFNEKLPKGAKVNIEGEEARHMHVLRLKKGDQICLFDGKGSELKGKIEAIGPRKVEIKIVARGKVRIERVSVDLATAVPKGKRFDWLIQKATELGVVRIRPIIAHRSVVKPKQSAKSERWSKIGVEAAKQSQRSTIPEITEALKFDEFIDFTDEYDLKLIALPTAEQGLKEVLRKRKPNRVICLVGPEGGFTDEEIEEAKRKGFIPVRLGREILRIETAGIAILSMINYEYRNE